MSGDPKAMAHELLMLKDPRGDEVAMEAAIIRVIDWMNEQRANGVITASPRLWLTDNGMYRAAANEVVHEARKRWRLSAEDAADINERASIEGIKACTQPKVTADGTMVRDPRKTKAWENRCKALRMLAKTQKGAERAETLRQAAEEDPDPWLYETDHRAIQGYQRELARMHGTDKPAKLLTEHTGTVSLDGILGRLGPVKQIEATVKDSSNDD